MADDRRPEPAARPAPPDRPAPSGRARAPATGSASPAETELTPEEEPNVSGALFLSMVMLMLIAGAWIVMFVRLVDR
jgi:hypothetical protein